MTHDLSYAAAPIYQGRPCTHAGLLMRGLESLQQTKIHIAVVLSCWSLFVAFQASPRRQVYSSDAVRLFSLHGGLSRLAFCATGAEAPLLNVQWAALGCLCRRSSGHPGNRGPPH